MARPANSASVTGPLLSIPFALCHCRGHASVRGQRRVPDTQTQGQRGLLRTRKQLTRERTRHIQRLQKTLEEANIKLELGDFRPNRHERTGYDRGLDRGRD